MKRSHTPEGNATVPDPRPGDDDEDTALKVSERRLRLMGYPEALIKAVQDPFDYALCLRDGTTIRFEYAEPQNDEWVGLRLIREGDTQAQNDVTPNPAGCTFNRGIEVRLADIMWVADAPYGS